MKKAAKKAAAPARRAKPAAPASAPSDPRIAKLCAALAKDPRLAPSVRELERARQSGAPRKFGSNGLKAGGKLFALFTQDTLVVKLPKERVSELAAAGQGQAFDPGRGRLMKEWLTVTHPKASWLALASEAFAFVAKLSRSSRSSRSSR
jgi:hypothetical protein